MRKPFESIAQSHTARLWKWKKQFSLLGNGKLLLILPFLYCLYHLIWVHFSLPVLMGTIGIFAVLAALWALHLRADTAVRFHQGMLDANQRYLDRIDGKWTAFAQDGGDATPPDHPYAKDLDILGPGSLYQYLCAAHTWHGQQAFAGDLLHADYERDDIGHRQTAIAELARMPEFLCRVQYVAGQTGSTREILPVLDTLDAPPAVFLDRRWDALWLWFPVLPIALFALSFLLSLPLLRILALVLCCAQAVVWMIYFRPIFKYLAPVTHCPAVMGYYAKAMEVIGQEQFSSPLLREIQTVLDGEAHGAIRAIRKLDSIASRLHLHSNAILYFLANVLFLWDIRCAIAINRWKAVYGKDCRRWFETLGTFESLMSFAGLALVCDHTCFPEVMPGEQQVSARALGHPLLPNEARVCNDLELREEIFIISGSNMSGKTTFLRSVGINLVLANAGGPVCADQMACGLFQILTSMRIADNLNEGISTFYAELRQVKRIIDAARAQSHLFFLIDEIFRGTNSSDRLFGAQAVVTELAQRQTLGMITTHDLALCDLSDSIDRVENYSFCEHYDQGRMSFDYQLHPGKAQTTNARFLMQQIGLL